MTTGYRKEEQHLRKFAVDSATVIKKFDLLWLDTDDVKPAADIAWDTNLATTQGNFAAVFAGVAMEPSPAGDTKEVSVATRGIFEFNCAAATFEIGDKINCAKATGDALENQKVVGGVADPIGKVAKREPANSTTVYVEIRASVVPVPAS